MTPPLRIAERSGSLLRLDGVPGWLAARDLAPCGRCGGVRFRYQGSTYGWYCVACHPLRGQMRPGPEMDVAELKRQLRGMKRGSS